MNRLHAYLLVALVFIAAAAVVFFPIDLHDKAAAAGNETAANLSDPYYEYPKTLQGCEENAKRDFCIDDLAEMTGNITLCSKINDPDIGVFCRARLLPDEGMCRNVVDSGLRETCLESIKMKKNWTGG